MVVLYRRASPPVAVVSQTLISRRYENSSIPCFLNVSTFLMPERPYYPCLFILAATNKRIILAGTPGDWSGLEPDRIGRRRLIWKVRAVWHHRAQSTVEKKVKHPSVAELREEVRGPRPHVAGNRRHATVDRSSYVCSRRLCSDSRTPCCSYTINHGDFFPWDRNDIAGWCDSPGALATWNIFRRGFADEDDHAPDIVLDHSRYENSGDIRVLTGQGVRGEGSMRNVREDLVVLQSSPGKRQIPVPCWHCVTKTSWPVDYNNVSAFCLSTFERGQRRKSASCPLC